MFVELVNNSTNQATSTFTNSSGGYTLNVLPGTFTLNFNRDSNDGVTLREYYNFRVDDFSLAQSTVLDFTLPLSYVDIHVQNSNGDPVNNVRVIISPVSSAWYPFPIGNGITALGNTSGQAVWTDSLGNRRIALLTYGVGNPYSFAVTPPGNIYIPFTVNNVVVSGDQAEIISLQFSHDQPVTTIDLTPAPNSQGNYSDPTTVTLLATAAPGFTIANTYYTLDGGSQQTYSVPFEVSGDGDHSVTYWSIDNAGVPEAPQTTTFTIQSTPQLTSLAPAQVWVGLKNSDAVGIRFDLLAEVYKGTTLVTSGQLDSVRGGSSGFNNARLNEIPFNTFSPVAFPSGSNLSLKLYVRNACVGSGKNSGTARLWFNDSQADSQFGATIDDSSSDYYLSDNSTLLTSPGPGPKLHIDTAAGAKCSPFKEFGTWTMTP